MDKWDWRWLKLAEEVSTYSKDPSTRVGAVIAKEKKFFSFGYNGFPATCPDKEEWLNDREKKYLLVVHAEINAIFNSSSPVHGCTVYTYPLACCSSCATLLAAAGIQRMVSRIDLSKSKTQKYLDLSNTEFILNANGIEYEWVYTDAA